MNSEQWQQVLAVFDEAVALSPDERDVLLSAALEGQPGLLDEVRLLLESHEDDPEFLETPAATLGYLEEPGTDAQDPERIGPYRVIERIGVGGMGTVYLAERDDDQYRKRVAVKLIKRGMDSEQILARFRAERQILASLEHPGIARLYDGGIAEDGRPYFVLEHIDDALPIDRYCDTNGLGVRARLQLFREACDAVQYAHRKLIVHRDLKPSNLLVSKGGQVKLLDFGIAKLLDASADGFTEMALTQPQMRLLTPEYASPEQVRGEPLSTTSDVYSLGVLLYRLLTGERPYRARDETSIALADAICTQEPEKPSSTARRMTGSGPGNGPTEVRIPAGTLQGDLDNIVLMALRKEPEARYASVNELSADIGRHLERRPVLARPQTAGYRLKRFTQRHALAVTLSGLAALFLIGGVAGTLWQARTAGLERDRARAEARKAVQVADVLADLFRLSAPEAEANASTMTIREFADRAEQRVVLELADQPDIRARLEAIMGRLNTDLARYDRSRDLLESALVTQRELYPEGHPDLVATLEGLGILLVFQQDFERARDLLEEALAMTRALQGDGLEAADILSVLAEPRALLHDADGSKQAILEATAIRRQLLPENHPLLAESLGGLAVLAYGEGNYEEAARYGEQALAIQREVHGTVSQAVAHELNNLGAIYAANGQYLKALETHREALSVRTAVYGENHPYVAFSYGHLGSLSRLLGDSAAAVPLLRRALEIREAAYGRRHRMTGQSLGSLGVALTAVGEYDDSAQLLREAVKVQESVLGDSPGLADVVLASARNECARGQCGEALPDFLRAVEIYRQTSGVDHPSTAEAEAELARALVIAGRLEEADPLLRSALASLEAGLPAGHLEIAPVHLYRGDLERALGHPDAARDSYERALRILVGKLPPEHGRIEEVQVRLATLAAE